MARKTRDAQMVRSVGALIICHHADCGDPRSGQVINQVAHIRYAAAAIAGHMATHPTTEQADPLGGEPPPQGPGARRG